MTTRISKVTDATSSVAATPAVPLDVEEYLSVCSESSTRCLPSAASQAGPTLAQKAALSAVPMGSGRGSQRARGGRGKKKQKFVAKVYNLQASRPFPLTTLPTQSITVTFNSTTALFNTSTTVPVLSGTYFTLSTFPDYAQFTSVFDQYRFVTMEVWIESTVCASSTVVSTLLGTAVDLDDANTPGTKDDVFGLQGCIVSDVTTGHYHRWQPHMAVAAYSGAFTSYANEVAGWIDSASPSVQHFGVKCAALPDGVARSIQMSIRGTIMFRGAGI